MFSFKRQVGNKAEKIVLAHLCQQGLTLVEQNYLTKLGEIDIIMLDKNKQILVFIEVRYRANNNFGLPVDSVNSAKRLKLIRTAHHYLQQHPQFDELVCRFDVVGVKFDLKCPNINWIKNAFEL